MFEPDQQQPNEEVDAKLETLVPQRAVQDRRALAIELVVAAMLFVGQPLTSAILTLLNERDGLSSLHVEAPNLIIWTISLTGVALLLMWKSGSPWAAFGVVRPKFPFDLVFGLLIFGVLWVGTHGVAIVVWDLLSRTGAPYSWLVGASDAVTRPEGLLGVGLVVAASLFVGFGEEIIVRGYLQTRLEQLLASPWKAVPVASLLFASYHCYQGLYGLITIFLMSLAFGAIFVALRRLWPLCIAHVMYDVVVWL